MILDTSICKIITNRVTNARATRQLLLSGAFLHRMHVTGSRTRLGRIFTILGIDASVTTLDFLPIGLFAELRVHTASRQDA